MQNAFFLAFMSLSRLWPRTPLIMIFADSFVQSGDILPLSPLYIPSICYKGKSGIFTGAKHATESNVGAIADCWVLLARHSSHRFSLHDSQFCARCLRFRFSMIVASSWCCIITWNSRTEEKRVESRGRLQSASKNQPYFAVSLDTNLRFSPFHLSSTIEVWRRRSTCSCSPCAALTGEK